MSSHEIPEHISELDRDIRLLVLDVDGVLTDGKLYFSGKGAEIKAFNTMDGLGLKLLQNNGIQVALISGRESEIVSARAGELGIGLLYQGRDDKKDVLDQILEELGIPYAETAYAGDDLPDLACITESGLGISVPNGHYLAREAADVVTVRHGGDGAVREICDWILKAQNKLEEAVAPFR